MMDEVKNSFEKTEVFLGTFDLFNKLQETTKLPKAVIALGGVFVGAGLLWAIFGPGLLTNLIGFTYPAYASFRAIESPSTADDTLWLTYWVVFSFFSIPEVFSDQLENQFPIYHPFKFAFLIWLMAPQTQGAVFIYKNFLSKYLLRREGDIDAALRAAETVTREVVVEVQEQVEEIAQAVQEEGEATEGYEQVQSEEQ